MRKLKKEKTIKVYVMLTDKSKHCEQSYFYTQDRELQNTLFDLQFLESTYLDWEENESDKTKLKLSKDVFVFHTENIKTKTSKGVLSKQHLFSCFLPYYN